MAAILVPAGTGRMDQQELVAMNEDLGGLHKAVVGQTLDEDVDQLVFVVVIEHVGEAVRCHSDASSDGPQRLSESLGTDQFM